MELGDVFVTVFRFLQVSIITPIIHIHLPSTCYFYQRDKRAKSGKLLKRSALSDIESKIFLVFERLGKKTRILSDNKVTMIQVPSAIYLMSCR